MGNVSQHSGIAFFSAFPKERTFLIITFCGHAEIGNKEDLVGKVLSVIKKEAEEGPVDFYLGGYGDFDFIALHASKMYKKESPLSKLNFVTPYLDEIYLKRREIQLEEYDEILYPEIEKTLPRYAITARNEWMMRKADFVIAYVRYGFGGAAKTFAYVKKRKKPYINLAEK